MAFLNTRESAELETPAETAVEGEIRDFVRRDVANSLRRQPESDSEMVAINISTLLQRVAGTSVQEIDRLIAELQALREMLHNEGARVQRVAGTSVQEIDKLITELQTLREMLHSEAARVQREIVEYATLSQAALQSTKIIAESLTHWKKVPDAPSLRD